MIIGLSGYAGAGKDTVANIIVNKYGYKRFAFADAVRDFAYQLNSNLYLNGSWTSVQKIVDELGWDKAKRLTVVREHLQTLGLVGRNIVGQFIWVETTFANKGFVDNVIITDVRFKNEANCIRHTLSISGEIWRVERPNVGAINDHISEHDMDTYSFDYTLKNNGTLEELEALIDERITLKTNANKIV